MHKSLRSYALKFSCEQCDLNFAIVSSRLDWGPEQRLCDIAEKLVRDWRGSCLEVNERQREAYCTSSGYASEDVSSFNGKRVAAKHQSKMSDMTVLSMWVPMCVMKESRLCTFVICRKQHLAMFFSMCPLKDRFKMPFSCHKENGKTILQTSF